jgi:hypothetical protein
LGRCTLGRSLLHGRYRARLGSGIRHGRTGVWERGGIPRVDGGARRFLRLPDAFLQQVFQPGRGDGVDDSGRSPVNTLLHVVVGPRNTLLDVVLHPGQVVLHGGIGVPNTSLHRPLNRLCAPVNVGLHSRCKNSAIFSRLSLFSLLPLLPLLPCRVPPATSMAAARTPRSKLRLRSSHPTLHLILQVAGPIISFISLVSVA